MEARPKTRLATGLLRLALTLLLAGLLGVALVRLAPGFGSSEDELNTHLSQESMASLRASRETNVFRIYGRFLIRASHGDLGASEALGGMAVTSLLRERLPVTAFSVIAGLVFSWTAALLLAGPGGGLRRRAFEWIGTIGTESLLAIPAGLLALMLFLGAGKWESVVPSLGIGLVAFPHLYRYSHQAIREAAERPHVLSAYARGSSPGRVLIREILPAAMPQLVALAGTSVPLAIGAAIPVETICDSAGLGQLAWKAASARDLELLLPIILLVSAIALIANFAADVTIAERKVAA